MVGTPAFILSGYCRFMAVDHFLHFRASTRSWTCFWLSVSNGEILGEVGR